MAESGRIRSRKTNFAAVSNEILHRKDVSLKAKGLYALIQSFICIPDYKVYKQVLLQNYSSEGRDGFNAAWNELKKLGYLITYKVPGERGHIAYEFELLDSVLESPNETEKPTSSINTQLKELQKSSPCTGFPYTVKPSTAVPSTVNPPTNNKYNNKKYNNNIYNTNKFDDDETKKQFEDLVKEKEKNCSGILESKQSIKEFLMVNFVLQEIPQSFIDEQMPMRQFMSSDDKFNSYVSTMWKQDQIREYVDNLCVESTEFRQDVFTMKIKEFISDENTMEESYILSAIKAYKNNVIAIFKINNASSAQWKIVFNKAYSRLHSTTDVQNPKGYCYRIIEQEIVNIKQ